MAEPKIIQIPLTKVKGRTLPLDLDAVPQHVYEHMLALGAEVLLNSRMSKVGAVTKLSGEELAKAEASAMEIAEANLKAMLDGTIKIKGQKAAGKATGEVMTEARRLARNIIKDQLKAAGEKVSHYEASEITKAANALIASSPDLIKQAEASLAERKAVKATIDLATIKPSEKLIAKAEKDKADKKAAKAGEGKTISAKQAGVVAQRAKPPVTKPAQTTAH